jgi:hypothetical protein
MENPQGQSVAEQFKIEARRFQEALRRALATPQTSNEKIEPLSKDTRRKRG